MKLLIKDGNIMDVKTGLDSVQDILIVDGIIHDIGSEIDEAGCEVIDAKGLQVIPGLVDAHCPVPDWY